MSVNARVDCVRIREDGSGVLYLSDFPLSTGIPQAMLTFDVALEGMEELVGLDVWLGSEGLLLGGVEIAGRLGFSHLVFRGRDALASALATSRGHES
jgi:hypothetical protein